MRKCVSTAIAALCLVAYFTGCAAGPEEQEQPQTYEQINTEAIDLAARVMAVVKIEPAERDEPLEMPGYGRIEGPRREGMPIELTGVFVEDGRFILVQDYGIPLDDFGKVTIHTWDGREYIGTPHSYTTDAPGLLIKVETKEGEEPPQAVVFEEIEPFKFGDSYLSASFVEENTIMEVSLGGGALVSKNTGDENDIRHYYSRGKSTLVLDNDGRPVGFNMAGVLWDTPDGQTTWRGTTIMNSPRITCEEMENLLKSVAADLAKSVIKLKLVYRDEKGGGYGGYSSRPEELFAIVVDDRGTVFVSLDMEEETVKRIDEISFEDKDGVRHMGAFVGLSKYFGGFVVRFDDPLPVPPVAISAADRVLKGQRFVSAHIIEKRGKTTVLTQYNRIMGALCIEKSKYNPDPPSREDAGLMINSRLPVEAGDLALTIDGELIAFISNLKYPDAPKNYSGGRLYRADWSYDPYMGDHDSSEQFIMLSRIGRALAGEEDRFEEDVKPKTKREGKQVVWLGVEFQGMNKDLAEALEVKGPTDGGGKGLLVVHVYPDSPAAKLGIKKGDILLEIIPEGKIDQKKELKTKKYGGYRGYGMPSWRDRRNYLTRLLTEIGKGKEVELKYVQDKKEKSAVLTLEIGPPDFQTTEKYKDEITGLTVRNLTYEVRHYYKVKDEDAGVVIEKVESGSPAEVAELIPRLLVRRINNVEVKDVEHFKQLIREAREARAKSLTFFVEILGITQFAELKPNWDEAPPIEEE